MMLRSDEGLKLDDVSLLFIQKKKKMKGTTLLEVDFGQFWSSFNDLHFTGSQRTTGSDERRLQITMPRRPQNTQMNEIFETSKRSDLKSNN